MNNRTVLGKAGASTVEAFKFVTRNALVIDEAGDGATALGVSAETAASGKQLAIVVEGFCEVDFAGAVAPGTHIASDANGEAVAATAGEHILGEYCPAPADGAIANSAAGTRGRILLYGNKMTIKL